MNLICVHISYALPEAVVIDGLLRCHGLHPHVQGGQMASVTPHYLVALGGMRVLVPEPEFEAASKLINEATMPLQPSKPESAGFWRAPLRNGCFGLGVLFLTGIPTPIWRLPQYPGSSDQG